MNIRFSVVGEGQPDHIIIRIIIHGFFNDKSIVVNRLFPEDKESGGYDRVFKFLATKEFRIGIENCDYIVVQIDTNECQTWNEGITHIGGSASEEKIDQFIEVVKKVLIKKIGEDYPSFENKIIFAITVHDLECWFFPFHSNLSAEQSKILSCKKTMAKIAGTQGLT